MRWRRKEGGRDGSTASGAERREKEEKDPFEPNSRLSAAVRLIDGGSGAVHVDWAFGKTLTFFHISLLQS